MMSIAEAIEKSESTGQIVHVEYDGNQHELIEEIGSPVDYADDFVGGKPVVDVWSTTGPEWRINVTLNLS